MIDRILIAEDHESANISVQKTLEELGITDVDYAYYCDDALSRIKTARQLNKPYDLLITDLYFEEDSTIQQLSGGIDLIAEARKVQPEIKVLVFSAENKATVLETLITTHEIDGYVRKARNDSKELKLAIKEIGQHKRYLPRYITQAIKQKKFHDFSKFEITIITLLAKGVPQKDIPDHLRKMQIEPSGLSSVEKRLKHIKNLLECSTNEQLVAFCKDMGII